MLKQLLPSIDRARHRLFFYSICTGEIPPESFRLSSLEAIHLCLNQLTGKYSIVMSNEGLVGFIWNCRMANEGGSNNN